MKKMILSRFLVFLMCLPILNVKGQSRLKQNINREWKFIMKDIKGAEFLRTYDSNWDDVHLPHSFSLPYFMGRNVYQGYGWYAKEINIPAKWKEKNITLEFEGAFIEKDVFVNGKFIGKHVGGYTGFFFDITKELVPGKNVIAVRINNLWNPRVAPRAGDHQFSGGIYRDVYLNITDKLHVDVFGTFVLTSLVNKEEAQVEVRTEVKNNYRSDKRAILKTEIKSPDGKVVAETTSVELVKQGEIKTFFQKMPKFKKPHLWSPESPSLYKAVTTITIGQKVVDSYETTFGVRKFEWTADRGFFLNDQHYYLIGANVHQDQAGWGDAVTNAAMRRDVLMMKEAGFNCIRGSHYPHDPAFSKACDELGIILFQENAFWGMGGSNGDRGWGGDGPSSSCYPPKAEDQPDFDKSVLSQLKAMIKINRNHASVAAWSMSNEAFFTDNTTDDRMRNLLNMATDSSRKWDPTREVAIGGAQRKGVDRLGKNAIAFYNGDGATLYLNPGFPNLVSEYGSTVANRPGQFIPGWSSLANGTTDGFYHPVWRSGQIIWCGFDHGTIGGEALATMGMVDYFRIPKRQYYWYQQAYKKGQLKPVEPKWPSGGVPHKLKLEVSNQVIGSTDGTDDTQVLVSVLDDSGRHINNNIPVELEILSGPGQFPTGTKIQFLPPSKNEGSDIVIRDGQAAIAFRSYYAGKTVIRATSPGLAAATINITTKGNPIWVEGVTPKSKDRPYKRYVEEKNSSEQNESVAIDEMLLATNRPSWVSSNLSGTSKANVNDGDSKTFWKPANGDGAKWWKLALEAAYCVKKIHLEFPVEGYYDCSIEVSSDDVHWKKMAENHSKEKSRTYTQDFGCNISFIRIVFNSDLAGLAEVKVGGIPSGIMQKKER